MSINIVCPHCRREYSIQEGRNDADWYELNKLIFDLPDVVQSPLWRYLELFKNKNKMTSTKLLALVKKIHPMIKAGQISWKKISYVVPPKTFAAAMSLLAETPPDTLDLPLKSHGYLLSMLAKQKNKSDAKTEIEQEQRVQVRTGEHLQGFRGHDQILAELDLIKKRQNNPTIELKPELDNGSKSIQQEK